MSVVIILLLICMTANAQQVTILSHSKNNDNCRLFMLIENGIDAHVNISKNTPLLQFKYFNKNNVTGYYESNTVNTPIQMSSSKKQFYSRLTVDDESGVVLSEQYFAFELQFKFNLLSISFLTLPHKPLVNISSPANELFCGPNEYKLDENKIITASAQSDLLTAYNVFKFGKASYGFALFHLKDEKTLLNISSSNYIKQFQNHKFVAVLFSHKPNFEFNVTTNLETKYFKISHDRQCNDLLLKKQIDIKHWPEQNQLRTVYNYGVLSINFLNDTNIFIYATNPKLGKIKHNPKIGSECVLFNYSILCLSNTTNLLFDKVSTASKVNILFSEGENNQINLLLNKINDNYKLVRPTYTYRAKPQIKLTTSTDYKYAYGCPLGSGDLSAVKTTYDEINLNYTVIQYDHIEPTALFSIKISDCDNRCKTDLYYKCEANF